MSLKRINIVFSPLEKSLKSNRKAKLYYATILDTGCAEKIDYMRMRHRHITLRMIGNE